MKILLAAVNAKFIHSNPAVYSLRAYAREWRKETEIAEYTINQLPEQILADLYERKADVIAFSCYIWNWNLIRFLLRELPKILPDTALWLGGPEVSYDAKEILHDYPALSGIMIGEGEETFRKLCGYYLAHEGSLEQIEGLCLPQYGYTAVRNPVDLNDIPFFYDDLEIFRNRILYYESSRGCPFHCSYCLSSLEKNVRFRSIETVFSELDFFLEHKVTQVKFIDRTFNCNHEHCVSIWRYLKEHDNGITNFHFEIAADLLNEEEITLLQSLRFGQVQLEIGVQTTNSDTLSAIRRKASIGHIRQVIAKLRANRNIHIHLDLIAGLPNEDLCSFRNSFDEVYRMGCEDLQLGFLKVLKGSFMAENAAEYDLRFLSQPPYEVLSTKWMSYGDLLELKKVEGMLEMYHNSNQFKVTLRQLEREFESPYELYLRLSEYYRDHGYDQNQPSRMEKYNILLGFAFTVSPQKEALYRELLTYDAYSRENCKLRPGFAASLAPYKEDIHRLQSSKENHIDVFFYRVWEENPGERSEKPFFVEFDSHQKSKISGNFSAKVLSGLSKEEISKAIIAE